MKMLKMRERITQTEQLGSDIILLTLIEMLNIVVATKTLGKNDLLAL
jgi:hypothetical protein